jgi:hypothetical protein
MPYHHQDRPRESRGHQDHHNAPLATERTVGERKEFVAELHENHRGQMVKLNEFVGSHRNQIIIGTEDLDEVIAMLQRIRQQVR